MHRLLIVDDLPIITDGLADLFQEADHFELEIFKAYSAFEALDILNKTKIDIVLSDINMPVKTGIDLLKEIRGQWPRCKVIFLTSYNEFDYAKEAISLGGFDFILKTQGDEAILNAVQKAADALNEELEVELLITKAKQQMKAARPLLQKEFLLELVEGKKWSAENRAEQFAELGIPFRSDAPVMLLMGRFDGGKGDNGADIMLLVYAVQNITSEYLSNSVDLQYIFYERSKILWFIQPKQAYGANDEQLWERTFRFVFGTLETIQDVCREQLKLPISFLLSSGPVDWHQAQDQCQMLNMLLSRGLGLSKEILMTDTEMQDNSFNKGLGSVISINAQKYFRIGKYSLLSDFLFNGQKQDFFELYHELTSDAAHEMANAVHFEIYHVLSSVFLSYLNRWNLIHEYAHSVDLNKLYRLDAGENWNEVTEYFAHLANLIFENKHNEQEENMSSLVSEIQLFIQNHLNGDLSLTRLGDLVHFNPSYLSRLYKQITGIGLSAYITEVRINKAKELLRENRLKVHEIALELGYHSNIAFTRWFKKIMNMSPQEYKGTFL